MWGLCIYLNCICPLFLQLWKAGDSSCFIHFSGQAVSLRDFSFWLCHSSIFGELKTVTTLNFWILMITSMMRVTGCRFLDSKYKSLQININGWVLSENGSKYKEFKWNHKNDYNCNESTNINKLSQPNHPLQAHKTSYFIYR